MTASDACRATILLAGRGLDLTRAADTLGALREVEIVSAQPEALLAGLDARDVDLLILAGEEALELCQHVRARVAPLALPIFVLGAEVRDALSAGASDALAGAWAGAELAARACSLVSTRRCFTEALAQARAEGRGAEGAADVEAKARVARTLDLLARAGNALAGPLDVHARIAALVRLVVPELGDFCGVYLVDAHGDVQLAEAAAVDPEHIRIARQRIARLGASAATHRVTEVVRSGRSLFCPVVTEADHAAMAVDAEDFAALRRKGTTSWLCVPLPASGRVLGAFALGRSGSARTYDEADLALAEDLGRRAAVGVDNAQLFELAERERRCAEEAGRLKDEFLANLNHELRTPLTAILGWARMLRTHTLPEEKRTRALEKIERNGILQAKLIEDLLDASRILVQSLELEIASVDVALVVETEVAALRPDADAKRLALSATISPAVGIVQADERRLRQIVEKLLSNAIKFTPPGGSIAVYAEPESAPEGMRITVTDTGAGIPAAFLPHVFDRFRQADGSTSRAHGGLGLGLAIAHHLVGLHGGTIEAHSEGEGRGATFVVRIPAHGA